MSMLPLTGISKRGKAWASTSDLLADSVKVCALPDQSMTAWAALLACWAASISRPLTAS